MASEIQTPYVTARTLYALVRNAVGQVWRTTTSAFVTYATANLGDYDIALVEQGTASGVYVGDFPLAVAGVYSVTAYDRAGGAPAEGDIVVGTGEIQWDGTVVVSLTSRMATYTQPAGFLAAIFPTDPADQSLVVAATDVLLTAINALNNLSQANVRTAVGLASANLDTQLDALPTNTELATALGTADDATLAAIVSLSIPTVAQITEGIGTRVPGQSGNRDYDYFTQGGPPELEFSADGLSLTVYSVSGAILTAPVATRLATTVGGLRSLSIPGTGT